MTYCRNRPRPSSSEYAGGRSNRGRGRRREGAESCHRSCDRVYLGRPGSKDGTTDDGPECTCCPRGSPPRLRQRAPSWQGGSPSSRMRSTVSMMFSGERSGSPGDVGHYARAHSEGRLSRSVKGIRLRVAVKCVPCAHPTLPRPLNRTLDRNPYSLTLNRPACGIPLTAAPPSTCPPSRGT